MTDKQLLTAVRAGMALMTAVCVAGLLRARSVEETFWLTTLAIATVFGLYVMRRY